MKNEEEKLIKEIMTQQSQETKQTDREPEEKLEVKALFQTKRIPANVLFGESTHGLQLQDHLHIKKEEEELWESLEEKQETDITAVTVKSEDEEEEAQCSLLHWRQRESTHGLQLQDHLHIKKEEEELWESLEEKQETDITAVTVKTEDEEEEAQCSLLHWRQSEENIKGEPATCSSAKLMKVEPNGDISEGPEAANTCTQPDSDGEETDCSDTEDSEDWREPLSQSEAQSEHMDMSCESFQTSEVSTENNTKETSHNREKPFGCDVCDKHEKSLLGHMTVHTGEKPNECDVCQKIFITKTNLNRHIKIHTRENPCF
ncbi:zinc finger and SCAN domain-containing protein 12-like isoform X2 [Gouania willdenowi]|uniref:zinc finger and SCAN domain-containing protein 12-like isoform X2 n=1 Tax=Gouania willdenowi TaxID=441366 RepID=UPI00105458C8|nr:zinc finger and SCAN domain-containing protein 12-like isoform X2 [Gouania willdenowi]